jgi:hypothetical protein
MAKNSANRPMPAAVELLVAGPTTEQPLELEPVAFEPDGAVLGALPCDSPSSSTVVPGHKACASMCCPDKSHTHGDGANTE